MKSKSNYEPGINPAFGHAVVIGSGIAGLIAAHVLTDHF
jgi:NADPH-dependent 2,4-dienoyl-CoA reductase/sulfur reductase-like enzyme